MLRVIMILKASPSEAQNLARGRSEGVWSIPAYDMIYLAAEARNVMLLMHLSAARD
jgi:hypothetical protein